MDLQLQRTLFHLASDITDFAPGAGAGFLDSVVHGLLTSPGARRHFEQRSARELERAGDIRRVLVLADVHLGDAVMLQSVVTGLRECFADVEIHYAASAAAAPLLYGNPEVDHLWPIFRGAPMPSSADHVAIEALCRNVGFDLVVNCCPFFGPGRPIPRELPVLDLTNHAPHLLRNERERSEPNHLLYQAQVFLRAALGGRFGIAHAKPIDGVTLDLAGQEFEIAVDFLRSLHWPAGTPLVLLNPDTASPFTRPPFEMLERLVGELADLPIGLLVGEGHTDAGVGWRLTRQLRVRERARVGIVPPSMGVGAYAALTDLVDIFVSGDTGPLHWAAARKRVREGGAACRNRTSVIGLFGATPARMSGYDSFQAGYLPAWQDAPSTTLVSAPACRNITCLNKLHKTCRVARCFEGLSEGPVLEVLCARLVALASSASREVPQPGAAWSAAPVPIAS